MGGSGRGQIRIIAGKWRSRKLGFPDLDKLRPTPDRVRETLFNWLQADIAGSRCLDLFSGSGALAFEAASRGAAKVVMVERSRDAGVSLGQNLELLKADNIRLEKADALAWLQQSTDVFDIVFLDPPYHSGLLTQCCELLESGKNLAENAKIYIEHSIGDEGFGIPDSWECLKSKSAGQVTFKLFSRAQ